MSLPAHTYPGSTLYSVVAKPPPDDLRLETLGRPATSFGPRSFLPTAADRIMSVHKHAPWLSPRPTTGVRIESLPGPINRSSYLVQPSLFDVRVGRASNLTVPFTMTSGLQPGDYARAPTPRVQPFTVPMSITSPRQLAPLMATPRGGLGETARPQYL